MSSLPILLLSFLAIAMQAPTSTPMTAAAAAPTTIRGPFDVKLTPQSVTHEGAAIGRMSLDKAFHGALEATSLGEMLAVRTEVADSAGYVAIERVTGTLGGRKGTFALQHSGLMNKGARDLTITVIPDSGTGELVGLSGRMTIDIQPGGKHFYEFTYSLLAPAAGK